jgi:hypothetical protein
MEIYQQLPPEAVQIALVLFLSFLIGLEREEHKAAGGSLLFRWGAHLPADWPDRLFHGADLRHAIAAAGDRLSGGCGISAVSYWHKISTSETAGVTTEMSGLATFLVGALVCDGHFWIATTLGVASLLLLDLKAALEKLAARIAPTRFSPSPSFCC